MTLAQPHPVRQRCPRAFTLVELMVSVVLVLLLLLGINTIFKMSSDTVGLGQAVNSVTRSQRAVERVLSADMNAIPKDPPLFVIHSMPASNDGNFLSAADRDREIDGDVSTFDQDGVLSTEETTSIADVNDRRHRADLMAFPIQGVQRRHTANPGEFVSNVRTLEAWMWLGHLLDYNKSPEQVLTGGSRLDPVLTDDIPNPPANDPLWLASNWSVGRVTILLRDRAIMAFDGNASLNDENQFPERFFPRREPASSQPPDFSPIGYGDETAEKAAGASPADTLDNRIEYIQSSRYDLAEGSITHLRAHVTKLKQWVRNNNPSPLHDLDAYHSNGRPVWQDLTYRFNTIGGLTRKPLVTPTDRQDLSRQMAQLSPILASNISQLIIEYAGDYLTQENDPNDPDWGEVTLYQPDGIIDFYIENIAPTGPVVLARKTRWYGLPRDTNGDGRAHGFATGKRNRELPDVVPLRDVVRTLSGLENFEGANFERFLPPIAPGGDYRNLNASRAENFRYTCIWTGETPRMVRVLMKAEDPNGRLRDGQWWEFVLKP